MYYTGYRAAATRDFWRTWYVHPKHDTLLEAAPLAGAAPIPVNVTLAVLAACEPLMDPQLQATQVEFLQPMK